MLCKTVRVRPAPASKNRDKIKVGKWDKTAVHHSVLGQILIPPGKAGVL